MANTYTDSDRLDYMIGHSYDKDVNGNTFEDFGMFYRFDGLTVEDMLEAMKNAIEGGGGGGGYISGGTISGTSLVDTTSNKYKEWEALVDG